MDRPHEQRGFDKKVYIETSVRNSESMKDDIPLTIRESGTLNTFKKYLKSHLFNND